MKHSLHFCAVARDRLGGDDFVKHLACFVRVATLSRRGPFRVVVATLRPIPHKRNCATKCNFLYLTNSTRERGSV